MVNQWIKSKFQKNVSKESQTISATTFGNFGLSHPKFLTTNINSLFIICKNHFFEKTTVIQKWALYREIFGPSIILMRKSRTTSFIPFHKKLYYMGISYRSGHYIIPNINLESHICKKWAHCSMIILTKNADTTRESKIVINNKNLELCFYVKLFLSYKILISTLDNDQKINKWINKTMSSKIDEASVRTFLENDGNILAYVFDELSDLGFNLNINTPQNRHRTNLASINMKKISDFHEGENNKLFIELINLSCVGSAHMP